MKALLKDFINELNQIDKEQLNKDKDELIKRMNEIETDDLTYIDNFIFTDNKFYILYKHFLSYMFNMNELSKDERMNLIQPDEPDNFKYLFNTFINFMAELNKIDNNTIKELIENQKKLNDDKYINKVKNSLDKFIPIVYNSLDDIILNEKAKEKVYDIRDKYITSAELSIILQISKATITEARKRGHFKNTIQDATKTKTQIPFKDIDKFCSERTKYLKHWTEYKNNL